MIPLPPALLPLFSSQRLSVGQKLQSLGAFHPVVSFQHWKMPDLFYLHPMESSFFQIRSAPSHLYRPELPIARLYSVYSPNDVVSHSSFRLNIEVRGRCSMKT